MGNPCVDVIVVNYRTPLLTARAIQSAASSDLVATLTIVDNSSEGADSAAGVTGATNYVLMEGNVGFAGGVNSGAQNGVATYILLLNSDAVVVPGSIEAMTALLESEPSVGITGPVLINEMGAPDAASVLGAPSLWSCFCFATGMSSLFRSTNFFNPEFDQGWMLADKPEVRAVSGGGMMVRRSVWHQLNGMDPAYFLYCEDVDFCYRARRAGWLIKLTSGARFKHDGGASSSSGGLKMSRILAGKSTFLRQHLRPIARVLSLHLLVLGVGVRAVGGGRHAADWREVWTRARVWKKGYPRARGGLFEALDSTTR